MPNTIWTGLRFYAVCEVNDYDTPMWWVRDGHQKEAPIPHWRESAAKQHARALDAQHRQQQLFSDA